MSTKKPKSLADIISKQSSDFGQLADAARMRADLSDYLRTSLDPSLTAGFVHCNMREGGTLVVMASSPEWAARLRFESQQFIDLCQKRNIDVSNVRVRVGY